MRKFELVLDIGMKEQDDDLISSHYERTENEPGEQNELFVGGAFEEDERSEHEDGHREQSDPADLHEQWVFRIESHSARDDLFAVLLRLHERQQYGAQAEPLGTFGHGFGSEQLSLGELRVEERVHVVTEVNAHKPDE